MLVRIALLTKRCDKLCCIYWVEQLGTLSRDGARLHNKSGAANSKGEYWCNALYTARAVIHTAAQLRTPPQSNGCGAWNDFERLQPSAADAR